MIKETGKVIEFNNGVAKILINPSPACNSCQVCKKGKEEMIMEVTTDLSLSPGQMVGLKIEAKNFLFVSFILYIVPIIDFIIGIILGRFFAKVFALGGQDEFGIIFGFLFFFSSFFIGRWVDKKLKKKGMVEIEVM